MSLKSRNANKIEKLVVICRAMKINVNERFRVP